MTDTDVTPEILNPPIPANADAKEVESKAAPPEEGKEEESATSKPAEESADGAPTERQNKGVGKRINELTREKYEAIRKAEALAAELAAYKQQQQQAPSPTDRPKPTLESCNYDPEAFAEAVAEWKIEQSFAKREASYREAQQRKAVEAKQADFQKRLAEFDEVSPGAWERAVTAPIKTTEPMLEVIRESDVGPHIAVWLADNLDEANAISGMPPYLAAARLGQIEATIKSGLTRAKSSNTTKAPPPPPRVAGSGKVEKSPEQMTMAEYAAWRASQEKRRY